MQKRISVITINYNGLKDTCVLLDSIPQIADIEIIVVDNASREGEALFIEQHYPNVNVIHSEHNLGFAGGNNLGIKAAQGKYLFLINNDTEFLDGEWDNVEKLIHRLESDKKIAIVCPKIRFSWDDKPIQFTGYTPLTRVTLRNRSIGYGEKDHGQYDQPHTTPYAHGAAMMVRREAIEKVGLMPECYFLYYEELDWSMMFTRAGYEIWCEPSCTIYHKESRSTGRNSPLKTYFITRNRLLFVKRNSSSPSKYAAYAYLICIAAFKDIAKHVLTGQTRLAKATIRGVSDFLFKSQT